MNSKWQVKSVYNYLYKQRIIDNGIMEQIHGARINMSRWKRGPKKSWLDKINENLKRVKFKGQKLMCKIIYGYNGSNTGLLYFINHWLVSRLYQYQPR